MPYVRDAVVEDIAVLARRMRAADAAEVRALSGKTPAQALSAGFCASDIPVVICLDDDTPVAMFGTVPSHDPLIGVIWLLGTDDLVKVHRRFLRESRQWIDAMHTLYPILTNVTDARNTLHHRWLKWCGFHFLRALPIGVEGRDFIEFARIKPHV